MAVRSLDCVSDSPLDIVWKVNEGSMLRRGVYGSVESSSGSAGLGRSKIAIGTGMLLSETGDGGLGLLSLPCAGVEVVATRGDVAGVGGAGERGRSRVCVGRSSEPGYPGSQGCCHYGRVKVGSR